MDICGASVFLKVPILRDFAMWGGGRDVTQEAISHALTHSRSVLISPGGQAEMKESRAFSTTNQEIVIVTKHKGFVRLALKYGADLVPLFSFGETEIFQNVFSFSFYITTITIW